MRKILIYICFFFIGLNNLYLHAWWDEGHMVVAKIAYDRLDPEVRVECDRLIEKFKNFFPHSPTFITASCWADDLGNYGFCACSSWHHSSLPYDPYHYLSQKKKKELADCLEGKDTLYALEQCVKTLQDPQAFAWVKGMMLRFLIHFVGDLHQPLHCACLYSPQFPNSDWGGNLFCIQWPESPKPNLHAFWDSICGLGMQKPNRPLSPENEKRIEQLTAQITSEFPESAFSKNLIENSDFYEWREEGFQIAVDVAYSGIELGSAPSCLYVEKAQRAACSQLALAGYRLAFLLNRLKAS